MADRKGWAQRVVARVDAPPIRQLAEHILAAIALTVESSVVRDGDIAPTLEGMGTVMAAFGARLAEAGSVVASVGEHRRRLRQRMDQHSGVLLVAGLRFGRDQTNGTISSHIASSLVVSPPRLRPMQRGRAPF